MNSFVQVSGEAVGAVHEIYSLTANGKNENVSVDVAEKDRDGIHRTQRRRLELAGVNRPQGETLLV